MSEREARLEEALRAINDIQESLPIFARLDAVLRANSAIRKIVRRALAS